MADASGAGNPMGPQRPVGGGPPPAAPRSEPVEQRSEVPEDTPRAAVVIPQELRESLGRMASTLDQNQAELMALQKRIRANDRQLIMILGVLALIAWRVGKPRLEGAFSTAIKDAEVVDATA